MIRKMSTFVGAMALALCSTKAMAQMPETTVGETMYAGYDLSALKGGEWVQYETKTEMVMGGNTTAQPASGYMVACVGVEGDSVWIESDMLTAPMAAYDPSCKDAVVLCEVDKKTGNIKKAWKGKKGEAGKEIVVNKVDASKPVEGPDTSGTAKVSKDTVKVGAGEFACERIDMDLTTKASGTESKTKMTTWVSEKVAFGGKPMDEKNDPYKGKVKWEGKPSVSGGMAKMVMEAAGPGYTMKSTTELIKSGSDAKKSLK